MTQSSFIVLENGQVFKGESFGADGETVGEIVFTTGMTGYLETLTDPSYYGQIVVQTFPLIGNYGVIPDDFESSSPKLKAYIVREWCQFPSNFRSRGGLDAFLKIHNIIGVCGIDTRELTKIIREFGVMNTKITATVDDIDDIDDIDEILAEIKNYKITDAVQKVSTREISVTKGAPGGYKVVLWDFGAKENIRRELIRRGCEVVTVPAHIAAEKIVDLKPDGIMLSNGPGDPADNKEIIKELANLTDSGIPIFGICLGHQLLALAQGAKTAKLKYGHRGANQPVKDLKTGRVYITSQNHGYAVVNDSLPASASISFLNANDGTCEGIEYQNMPAFTIQFHPEASAGPLDTNYLFDRFIDLIREEGLKCR
ncbi:MAG TPA: carbamoyl phosphate synthase small subunit [Desulfotomaculum sp.]|nr:MAG: Carbamoyl-phosphate synthase small chain [Desulfotomaculum sp. 46_296]HAG12023.1 carbamoyl phosphate synthase small subunit [Desulfotomaculum sp.]HBY05283.1 carbamoyl phosphate synthase small subunit [Desulfotomaculum sp.]